MWIALRFAAGKEGARRAATGRTAPLAAIEAVDAVGEADVRSAAGA